MSQVNELSSAVSEILIDEETLQGRIADLGAQVSDDYRGRDLLLIGVLKGAIFFMADLMRSIEVLQTRVVTDSGSVPTIVLTPEFESIPAAKLRNFRDGRRYIAAGEAAVEAALPRLQGALPWLRPLDSLPASDPGGVSAASLAGAVVPD